MQTRKSTTKTNHHVRFMGLTLLVTLLWLLFPLVSTAYTSFANYETTDRPDKMRCTAVIHDFNTQSGGSISATPFRYSYTYLGIGYYGTGSSKYISKFDPWDLNSNIGRTVDIVINPNNPTRSYLDVPYDSGDAVAGFVAFVVVLIIFSVGSITAILMIFGYTINS